MRDSLLILTLKYSLVVESNITLGYILKLYPKVLIEGFRLQEPHFWFTKQICNRLNGLNIKH